MPSWLIVIIVFFILLIGVLSTWRKVPQDKALVVTGAKKRVITGGGGIIIPILERTDMISLENMNINVEVSGSLTETGVPLDVTGTIIVKISSTNESILAAMEQFNTGNLETTIENIKHTVQEVMEGKLRETVSTLSVEALYQNRERFTSTVQEVAAEDLKSMGLEIKTFTIRDISDKDGYLKSLGVKQTEEVKRQAAIAKAEAERDVAIQEAEAEKARQIAEAQAEAEAKAISLKGQAEAEAIRLKGQAEAEAMREKAEAYKQYGEAAILELLVEKLPEIAQAISAPLAQTDKIVIMDQGGENGGAAKIPGYINTIAGMVPEAVETLTGKNMIDIIEKALTKTHSVNTHINVADNDCSAENNFPSKEESSNQTLE